MAVPTTYSWVNGAIPGSTLLNPGIRDVDNFLLAPPRCRAYRATAGAALTAGTNTLVNLDGENYDSSGTMHSLVSVQSRIVAPETGLYTITAQFSCAITSASLTADLRINAAGVGTGGTVIASDRVAFITGGSAVAKLYTDWPMTAGDHVEMFANLPNTLSPNTGVNQTYMLIRWVASS